MPLPTRSQQLGMLIAVGFVGLYAFWQLLQ
jgi:hypothetical protein